MAKTAPTLDDESLKFLDQCKRGKPRKFVMICKGETIVSVVIYKKGSLAKFKKQAKEEGRGLFYHGVIEGKGAQLAFKLGRVDGFEAEPTKQVKLKQFLNEASGGTFKPRFEIVDECSAVLDEDDPLVQRYLALEPRILEACDKDAEAAKFFGDLCRETAAALGDDDSALAEQKIVAIERALDRVLGQGEPSPEELLWIQGRDELEPEVARCVAGNLGEVQKITAVLNFGKEKAAAGDFAAAVKSLEMLRRLIGEADAAGAGPADAAAIPEGAAIPGMQIRTARVEAATGISKLEEALRATGESRAEEIAEIIAQLGSNFPTHMERLLDGLAKAQRANNDPAAAKIKAGAKKAAADWIAYLKKHETEIAGCEANPWNIPVDINGPIKGSLKFILTQVVA